MPVSQAPKHLSPSSKLWWSSVADEYKLEPHHLSLLTMAAEALDRAEQARKLVEAQGLLIINKKTGATKTHPAVAVERDCRIAYARLIRELDLDFSGSTEPRNRPPVLRSNSSKRRERTLNGG